jgi:hypothetical protein
VKIEDHIINKGNNVFEVGPKSWSNKDTCNYVSFDGDDAMELYLEFKKFLAEKEQQ